ncbi:MAG: hypothetical protein AB1333_03040 [Patescibacteria group bacterium]
MVDSGADHTVIPFSIGAFIGLTEPTQEEKLANVSGVGGNLSYIERKCRIYVANRMRNKTYGFDETVWWIYPDADTQKQQESLAKTLQELQVLQAQSYPGSDLFNHFENQKKQTIDNFIAIANKLETGVLLGRPFFDNFDFIQFFHKDRSREDRCFFNYKVANNKAVEVLPIQQTDFINQIQATKQEG